MSSVKRRKTDKNPSFEGVKSKKTKESKKGTPTPSPEPIEDTEDNRVIEETEEAQEDDAPKSFKDLVRNDLSIAISLTNNSRVLSTHCAKHATL